MSGSVADPTLYPDGTAIQPTDKLLIARLVAGAPASILSLSAQELAASLAPLVGTVQGAQGPAGPAGPAGAQGPSGPVGTVATFTTMALLRLYSPVLLAQGAPVTLLGYNTAGDAGGGLFWWDALDAAPDDGGATIMPTGWTGAGRWHRLVTGDHRPEHYGAFGDGSSHTLAILNSGWTLAQWQAIYPMAQALTDEIDLLAIQAVLAAAQGQTVRLRALGNYQFNRALPILHGNINLLGEPGATINSTSTTADTISTVGAGTAYLGYVTLKDIAFTRYVPGGAAATAGWVINTAPGGVCFEWVVEDLYIFGNKQQFAGINFFSMLNGHVARCMIQETLSTPLQYGGSSVRGSDSCVFEDIQMPGCNAGLTTVSECDATGLLVITDFSSGLTVRNLESDGGPGGYLIYFATTSANAARNEEFYFSQLWIDGSAPVACGGVYADNCVNVRIGGGSWLLANSAGASLPALWWGAGAVGLFVEANEKFYVAAAAMSDIVYLAGRSVQADLSLTYWSGPAATGNAIHVASTADDIRLGRIRIEESYQNQPLHQLQNGILFDAPVVNFSVECLDIEFGGVVTEIAGMTSWMPRRVGEVISADANPNLLPITAAATINPPSGLPLIGVNGTTPIVTITPRWFGQRLRLLFNSSGAVIEHLGAGGNIYLQGGTNFTVPYDYFLMEFFCNGAAWFQV